MRCPSCNKFVSYDEPLAELIQEDVTSDVFTCEIRLWLTCSECGEELKEATLEIEHEIEHHCEAMGEDDALEFELSDIQDPEASDYFKDRDRHGKLIKNPRYRKHMYRADITATVKCVHCETEFDISDGDEVAASGMEELA